MILKKFMYSFTSANHKDIILLSIAVMMEKSREFLLAEVLTGQTE